MSRAVATAHAAVEDHRAALGALRAELGDDGCALLVLFASPGGDRTAIAATAAELFPGTPTVGCTTAGEIAAAGYVEGEIVAVGFRGALFEARTVVIDGLAALDESDVAAAVTGARAGLGPAVPGWDWTFAFLLVDGLSRREDAVVSALRASLGTIPLFGRSAGDGFAFRRTFVLADGAFREDRAVLALVRSRCPVRVFKFDNLEPSDVKMVVTDANPEARVVREINAEPAAREYARLVGKDPDQLSPFIFAAHPIVVRVGGQHHVRAIQKVEPNGDLTFFSAIDAGLVLTVARAPHRRPPRERARRALPRRPARNHRRLRLHPPTGRRRAGPGTARGLLDPRRPQRRRLLDLRRAVPLGPRQPDLHRPRHLSAGRGPAVSLSLVDPADPPERRNAKLEKIAAVLMARVEQATDESGAAYAQFQRALTLEEEVRGRTRDLEQALGLLEQSNARLSRARTEAEAARADLADAIESVREGFALFGSDDRLVLTNSRFCEAFPDLRPHLPPGLRFVEYIRRVAASRHLALPQGRRPPDWMRERLRHHRLPSATFNVRTDADRWVQVSEQRTPGGGTAILQTDLSDATYLRRIVQNLLANAVNYTRSGKVLLGARHLPGAVRIEVWDTGPGIPETEHASIFREFRRLPGSEGTTGLGLGLAIVERASTLLRHPIEIASVEGRGTGFRVTVPRAEGPSPAGPTAAGAVAFDPGSMTVLLVENDTAVATAFATLLEAWGVGALTAPGAEAALALLEDLGLAPDVILADYHLGEGADGIAAIAALRARHGPIPAMVVTADRTPEVAALCAAAGVSLMNKPVEPARLRAWLAGH
jgi:CheY-like chemotaxis protein/anti-sigma regulatory factor (Ser/Thr protein kinase)